MRPKSRIFACSALALVVSAVAQAREIRVDQRVVGSAILSQNPVGLFGIPGWSAEVVGEHRGAPGPATSRGVLLFGPVGPASERCAGFDFEFAVVGGTSVVTAPADLSQLKAVITSGFVCANSNGGNNYSTYESTIVGGTGRFEGASGTITYVSEEDSDVGPLEIMTISKGALTGTINLPN